jgi:hypothetical protein
MVARATPIREKSLDSAWHARCSLHARLASRVSFNSFQEKEIQSNKAMQRD